jgi:flagellar hook assembly protein FlgD
VVALAQNTPNPFNPATTIRFALPRDSDVNLRVFDLRGRLVRTLVDEVRPAGEHAVLWDGRTAGGGAAASGVYLYRLQAGNEVRQRRMTLVR